MPLGLDKEKEPKFEERTKLKRQSDEQIDG